MTIVQEDLGNIHKVKCILTKSKKKYAEISIAVRDNIRKSSQFVEKNRIKKAQNMINTLIELVKHSFLEYL